MKIVGYKENIYAMRR